MIPEDSVKKSAGSTPSHHPTIRFDQNRSLLIDHVFSMYRPIPDPECLNRLKCIFDKFLFLIVRLDDHFKASVYNSTCRHSFFMVSKDGCQCRNTVSADGIYYVLLTEDAFLHHEPILGLTEHIVMCCPFLFKCLKQFLLSMDKMYSYRSATMNMFQHHIPGSCFFQE